MVIAIVIQCGAICHGDFYKATHQTMLHWTTGCSLSHNLLHGWCLDGWIQSSGPYSTQHDPGYATFAKFRLITKVGGLMWDDLRYGGQSHKGKS
jgi:hypothetical protein